MCLGLLTIAGTHHLALREAHPTIKIASQCLPLRRHSVLAVELFSHLGYPLAPASWARNTGIANAVYE